MALYAVLGYRPPFVADMVNDAFYSDTSRSTFDDIFTHSRLGNATMVDSDGLLKWGPHNLLTYSEDFSTWGFAGAGTGSNVVVTASAETDPAGGTGAYQLDMDLNGGVTNSDRSYISSSATISSGADYTASVWVKSADASSYDIHISIAGGSPVVATVGQEWQRINTTWASTITSGSVRIGLQGNLGTSDSASVLVYGAHLYRSDLGGMAPVPVDARVAGSTTYVPTTSTAKYLPRRHNHVYNGSAWVDAGTLIEAEARVNLVTYSNLSTGWTIGATDSFTKTQAQAIGRDGELSLAKIAITDTTSEAHQIYTSATVTAGATYCLSVDAKFGTHRYWALRYWTATGAWAVVVFDLQTGVVTQTSVGGSSGTIVSSGIENYNGIFRVHLSASTSSGTTGYITIDACSTGTPTLAASDGTEVFTGTAGAYSYFGAAQLEAGSTPSSYIPTSGSTVTRAADTSGLTVDSSVVPWPTPKVIGDELVTNGDGSSAAGWSDARSNGTVTSTGGRIRSTATAGGAYGPVQQLTGLTAGNVYQYSSDVVTSGGAGLYYFRITAVADLLDTNTVQEISTTDFSPSGVFVATNSNMYVGVIHIAAAGGDYAELDNISVKEIAPLAVCIQMKGRMTYADTNAGNEVEFVRWYSDSNNRIYTWLNTGSTRVGAVEFYQTAGGVQDFAKEASPGSYSPGINVPFNIASRHGSTFINGAVDGVALTADLTPIALPDLSSTDLQIGYDFMGNIEEVRVWVVDIGDTGLEAATS